MKFLKLPKQIWAFTKRSLFFTKIVRFTLVAFYTIAAVGISLIVSLFIGYLTGGDVFMLQVFFMITALGLFSQTIVDNIIELIAHARLSKRESSRHHNQLKMIVHPMVICLCGLIISGWWLKARQNPSDWHFLNFGDKVNMLSSVWILVLLFLLILSMYKLWRFPFIGKLNSTGESVP